MDYGTQAAACHTSFIASSCWMMISLTKDLKEELHAINEIVKNEMNDVVELPKRLSEFVRFHSNAKQLS